MKLFKTVDDKIKELGFYTTKYDKHGLEYKRYNGKYTQVVAILHKTSGEHILQSYDPDLFDQKTIGNTCVGLSYKELRVFTKKFRKITRKWDKSN